MNTQSILSMYNQINIPKKTVKHVRVYETDKNQGTKNDIVRIVKEFGEVRTSKVYKFVGKSKSFTQMCIRCLIRENRLVRIKKAIGHHNTNVHFVRVI